MRIKVVVLTILIIKMTCFAQFKEGFTLETSVTGDFIKNLKGGINTDYTYIGMEDFAMSFDFESMGLWNGGLLFLNGLNAHGRTPSSEIVGDMQVTSNIEAGDYTGFYQYYYQQNFGRSSIIIGQHDLNSEFVGTEYGGTFLNSSFGIAPTISLNIPVSIYPMAALALIYKYEQPNRVCYKLGIYDGDPGDPENNRYNLQPNISSSEGFLAISEVEFYRFINSLPENFKIGGYYHSSEFTDYNDTTLAQKGNYGGYVVSDLVLWSGFNHPYSYLGAFIQGGIAPSRINQVNYYVGCGLHLNGMLHERYNDALGIAFAYANLSNDYKKNEAGLENGETTVEFTYLIQVFDQYTIQPNLQYVLNPGANKGIDNAWVASIRFNISL